MFYFSGGRFVFPAGKMFFQLIFYFFRGTFNFRAEVLFFRWKSRKSAGNFIFQRMF
jgi:hypothetical protein